MGDYLRISLFLLDTLYCTYICTSTQDSLHFFSSLYIQYLPCSMVHGVMNITYSLWRTIVVRFCLNKLKLIHMYLYTLYKKNKKEISCVLKQIKLIKKIETTSLLYDTKWLVQLIGLENMRILKITKLLKFYSKHFETTICIIYCVYSMNMFNLL